jgi:EAL domain-containing protein (putative c-di-GMP-specific phosphodiesterase class I)
MKTGDLSGFEALARWHHPERGIVSPDEFLPTLERAGLMQRLSDAMITQTVEALVFWEKSGLNVSKIGVNFSISELRDPRLVDRISLHLDAGNITPDRLVIEVLETVIAGDSNGYIVGNLGALADLGCRIDLHDFGTGHASITNIRRFSIGRIKIDRSFIAGLDTDTDQRDMVSAILTMAQRLGVTSLAEGVETRTEHKTLEALGCDDAQGFFFARPMPIQETVERASAYFSQVGDPIQISKRAS